MKDKSFYGQTRRKETSLSDKKLRRINKEPHIDNQTFNLTDITQTLLKINITSEIQENIDDYYYYY